MVDTVRNCGFSCLARVVISHEISFDNDYLFIIQLFAYYLMMPDFTWRTFPQLVIYFDRRKQPFSWAEFYQEFFKNSLRILPPSAFSCSCENNCFLIGNPLRIPLLSALSNQHFWRIPWTFPQLDIDFNMQKQLLFWSEIS